MISHDKWMAALLLGSLLVVACKPKPLDGIAASNSDRPVIYATNYPLAYFAERIGGTAVKVVFPVPGDVDPAFWEPTDAEIAAFQSANIILMNGATYSKWAEKVTLPESKIVDTSAGLKAQFITVREVSTHSHGKEGEHSHAGTAFTTWIDFSMAIKQAEAVKEAFIKLVPQQVELFALNYDLLYKELLELDSRMLAAGRKLKGRPLVASHPVYQYLARRYELDLQSVLWEPESVPSETQIKELEQILTIHDARHMLWEGEPVAGTLHELKALDVGSVVFDPCGNKPEQGSWKSVMESNVAALEKLAGTAP